MIAVGDVKAAPGTKEFGYLKVEDASTLRTFMYKTIIGPPRPRAVLIPVMIVNGSKPGPILCLTAGTHATEYPGVEAEIRTYRQTDPKKLMGALVIVPVVNPASFWTMTPYVNLMDGVDISRAYGVQGPTISYLIANTLLKEVFSKAEYIFDIHAGDLLEDFYPLSMYSKTGNKKMDEGSEMLARTFGTEIVTEGVLSPDDAKIGKPGLGIPQAGAEVGCKGGLEEHYVAIAVRGISNIMKRLGMIEGKPEIPQNQAIWHRGKSVFTTHAGLFYPKIKVGDHVKEGQIIGEIKDLKGDVLETLAAPNNGLVNLIMCNPVKLPGDLLFKTLAK